MLLRGSASAALRNAAASQRRAGVVWLSAAARLPLTRAPSEHSSLRVANKTAESAVSDIIYGFPLQKQPEDRKRHILVVLVDNEPGVLSKVSGLLSARGFNIESLSVSSTDVQDLSRMTIVLQCPDSQMNQAQRQLEDLVSVWAVLELKPDDSIERELLMCKIDCVQRAAESSSAHGHPDHLARHAHRQMVVEIMKMFDGKVSNVGTEHIVVEAVTTPRKVDAILSLLRPLGIIEAVRSGVLAMSKSHVSGIYDDATQIREKTVVDDSELPPG